jgi:hypothetical protein
LWSLRRTNPSAELDTHSTAHHHLTSSTPRADGETHDRAPQTEPYKTAYHVKNWRKYEQSRRARGDITLWITPEAISAWCAPMTGKLGAQPIDADVAIETAIALRLLFHLPRRQTEGFPGSALRLMGLVLPCPDPTTLSRRHATVAIRRQVERAPEGPISVIVDSTGLKVCGQGEWHAQKHGEKKHRHWRKLHLGVDDQGHIMASCVTDGHEQDSGQVPELLSHSEQEVESFVADGIDDQAPVYAAVETHSPGARVIIPPQDAAPGATAATSPTQRDQHMATIERDRVFHWRRTSGYDDQAYAENALARFKQVFGGRLRAKRNARPGNERRYSLASCSTRMQELGRPQSYPVD